MVGSEVEKYVVKTTLGVPEIGTTMCWDEFPTNKSISDIINYTLACKGLDIAKVEITKKTIKEIIIVKEDCE